MKVMIEKTKAVVLAVVTVSLLSGCVATQQQAIKSDSSSVAVASEPANGSVRKVMSKDGSFEGEIIGTPAPKSKFSKLQIGMSQRQVEDLTGQPSDMKTYTTGKSFIPFYFGGDAWRLETYYKKEGRLTYIGGGVAGSNPKLLRITVNANESGYQ